MYIPIFKFVAGVNREFIWELIFCLCNTFLLLSDKFRCVFSLFKIHSVCVPEANFKMWMMKVIFIVGIEW